MSANILSFKTNKIFEIPYMTKVSKCIWKLTKKYVQFDIILAKLNMLFLVTFNKSSFKIENGFN